MIALTLFVGTPSIMDALVVPADPQKAVKVIDLNAGDGSYANLRKEIGGTLDVVEHAEGDIWIHDTGRIDGHPINVRVSHWVLNTSQLAHEGRAGEWSVIFGDCVITGGPDREGESTAVDPALVEHFSSLQLAPNAVDDWTTRELRVIITDWPDLDRPNLDRDDGYDLGL